MIGDQIEGQALQILVEVFDSCHESQGLFVELAVVLLGWGKSPGEIGNWGLLPFCEAVAKHDTKGKTLHARTNGRGLLCWTSTLSNDNSPFTALKVAVSQWPQDHNAFLSSR